MWSKDGSQLKDEDMDMETTDKNTRLVIPDAQRSDSGKYELTLANEVGTDKLPILIKVIGKIHFHFKITIFLLLTIF